MSTKFTTTYLKSLATSYLWRRGTTCPSKTPTVSSTRVSTAPTAIPLHEIIRKLPTLFPRSINASVRDYQDFCYDSGTFQEDLLKTLPFFPHCVGNKKAEVLRTIVDDHGNYINEFCISPVVSSTPPEKMKHLIFVHGYGAGLGFFLKNLENIPLMHDNWVIHAIDLPGFGFSSRPKFPFKYPADLAKDVHTWFHDRLYTWFKKRAILSNPEGNLVMAHSLGAYLMALYTTKYENHFKKLVMCSPAGICKSTAAKRFGNVTPPWWYAKLWDLNVSPFFLVRNAAYFGSLITSGWSYRRFGKLLRNEPRVNKLQFEALHRYAYAIFNQRGSGEYLLSFVLSCGGDPRMALEDTIFKEKTNGIFRGNCEWLWIYGEKDWMDIQGGKRVSEFLRHGGKRSEVFVAPNSGHHLYFDNYRFLNEILIEQMKSM